MAPDNNRVVIVGGSIAGLSLALMLERNGIDFIVLEAYPSIAPQVGASISLFPSALRILEQLGCYEEIQKATEFPVDKLFHIDANGEIMWTLDDCNRKQTNRLGYPNCVLDRRMLIQILYDNIQQKDKILCSQRVASVSTGSSYATVTTKGGETYTGAFVIGADGVHSTVRKQMWEEANKLDPTFFDPGEAEAPSATYACVFGISQGYSGIVKGSCTWVYMKNSGYLIFSGPGDRTYWFLFEKMDRTVYGSEVPRLIKEDEAAVVERHLEDLVSPKVQFSDLYKHKLSSGITPLEEHIYKKWYFRRIMTVGDAAHKVNPITGVGGVLVLEGTTALTNNLVSCLNKNKSQLSALSTEDIGRIFQQTQSQREPRASALMKAAHEGQQMHSLETPLLRFMNKHIVPSFGNFFITEYVMGVCVPSISLDMFPRPRKTYEIPYYDELFRRPSPRGLVGYTLYLILAAIAMAAYNLLVSSVNVNGAGVLLVQAILDRSIKVRTVELLQSYTGLLSIDTILRIPVLVFSLELIDPIQIEQPLHLLYFLSSIIPLVGIFTVEGYRQRNQWTPIASPALWAILYQTRGLGLIAPFYFAASLFVTRGTDYFIRADRYVPEAKFILPALTLGYIMPTTLLFFPFRDSSIHQKVIAFWQFSPILVSLLTWVFSSVGRAISTAKESKENDLGDSKKDLPYLNTLYKATGLISACIHFCLVTGCLLSGMSLTRLFVPESSFAPVTTLSQGVFVWFQNDFLLTVAASLVWCLANIWDMRRSGLSNVDLRLAFCASIAGYGIIGPGATAAGIWLWREQMMSQKGRRSDSSPAE